ncbi:T9SS type A sorting domain-containing protein, partial [candidate division KSB1 bacterium]|nr:T9SS type A sorting domain-containing protein [candidate division KSB1 bacterium]
GKIYTIGGFIGSGTVLSAVEKYDPSKDLSGLIDDVYLSQYFVVAGSDSVCITTTISDPTGVTLFAEIEAPDQTPIDSLQLFDDGNHNDGNAGDSLYANVWPVSSMEERDYYVDLKVTQNEAETICHQMDNIAVFTTNGPISYESYTLKSSDTEPNPGDVLNMKVTLKNGGTTATALNIKAKLSSLNEFATVTSDVYRNFSNIAAGESKTSTSYYQLEISEDCPDNTEIQFVLDITSNGNSFWSDNFSILVLISATNVNTIENSPRQYSLDQNYPNPFNPSTKISYSIPISGFVELKVYDMLGREIQTLVSKFQNANTYSVNYNASNLANGIYLYKLQTDDGYSEMKKMIIIK